MRRFKFKIRRKYNNTFVEIDGFKLDSKREGNRYIELKVLNAKGKISNLKIHPVFKFPMGFSYEGDFQYIENGKTIVEDVKGFETDVFKLKKKCFAYFYQSIELRIVK